MRLPRRSRPFHLMPAFPAPTVAVPSLRTTTPFVLSTLVVTFAGCVSVNLAITNRRPVQQLAVEGHRRRVAGLEAGGRDATKPDEFLRQLVVREADAVADPAAVCGHEHDRAVATLADCGASEPRCEHHGGEVLKSTEHGLAVADEQRPAADRVDVVRPAGAEQVADNDTRAGRRLGVELLGRAARRRQDRSAGRNRRVAALT